ncbi:hypothetical protein [Nitrincola sp.]|uniref:hypothetical protein n=1 Tax=Nitrincola sp. TaxID=1926584 RepID=UPI003A91F4CD
MKDVMNLKFFACAFMIALVFFMVGFLTYGDVVGLVIENGFIDSFEKYWQFTLINGSVFALSGFVMVLYVWLDMLPKSGKVSFVLSLIKMMLVSLVVYAIGLFCIWMFYSSFPSNNAFFDGDIMVSIDELNVYWSAALLLAFWIVLLARLLVVRDIRYKQHQ